MFISANERRKMQEELLREGVQKEIRAISAKMDSTKGFELYLTDEDIKYKETIQILKDCGYSVDINTSKCNERSYVIYW